MPKSMRINLKPETNVFHIPYQNQNLRNNIIRKASLYVLIEENRRIGLTLKQSRTILITSKFNEPKKHENFQLWPYEARVQFRSQQSEVNIWREMMIMET